MIKGWLNPNINPEQLLASYRSTGERQYLTQLVEQFNQAIFHYLLSQSDNQTAEDVLQSTWLKVINNNSQENSIPQVKSWLFTIARNTLIDELRRQKRWQYHELELESGQLASQSLEKTIAEKDALTCFNDIINQLPFHQREAFIFQQEGFSIAEICQLTDENFETVKSRLRYARSTLKTQLGTKL